MKQLKLADEISGIDRRLDLTDSLITAMIFGAHLNLSILGHCPGINCAFQEQSDS